MKKNKKPVLKLRPKPLIVKREVSPHRIIEHGKLELQHHTMFYHVEKRKDKITPFSVMCWLVGFPTGGYIINFRNRAEVDQHLNSAAKNLLRRQYQERQDRIALRNTLAKIAELTYRHRD